MIRLRHWSGFLPLGGFKIVEIRSIFPAGVFFAAAGVFLFPKPRAALLTARRPW